MEFKGATSLAGCNLCHFEGRTFAKRTVFDGARRYCKHNDTTRLKDSQKNVRNNLHFSFNERRSHPKKRKYADYVASANAAAAENARRPSGTAAHKEAMGLAHIALCGTGSLDRGLDALLL